MPRHTASNRKSYGVLLVGRNRRSLNFIEHADRIKSKRVRIVGIVDDAPIDRSDGSRACRAAEIQRDLPDLGTLEDLRAVLTDLSVQEVHITMPLRSCYDEIGKIVRICQESGTPVTLCNEIFDGAPIASASGSGMGFDPYRRSRASRAGKRIVDILGALFGLAVFAVPMVLIAIAIKLTSRGPVFFAQERLGKDHQPFLLYKFRTMVPNAEALREELESKNEMSGPVFKMKHDPRITLIGRFLRRSSLDELPQLFNILRGEMSIVGPRPPLASEVRKYEWWQRRRLSVRPGLTCFWQISGRNEISFEEWMRLDLEYIDDWSLALDLRLIAKTVPAVLSGRGAA